MVDRSENPETGYARRFPHHMLREIYEQPEAIQTTIHRNLEGDNIFSALPKSIEAALLNSSRIVIAASGSSRHAGLAGEIMIEDLAGIPVDVEYSSEYYCRSTHAGPETIVIVITQSGETADTVAAQREALKRGAVTVAISNVANSTISREATSALITYAAPERAVPATKSFTAQLTVLYLFALFMARIRGRLTSELIRSHLSRLAGVQAEIGKTLSKWDAQAAEAARSVRHANAFFFIGRGVHYAIAREGALKLKEISGVEAEGLPAGELRHGTNALIDEKVPVVAIATQDPTDSDSVLRYQRTLGVLEYVRNCGGQTIAIATADDRRTARIANSVLFVPPTEELLLSILEIIPLQLLAYHFATLNGFDVDRPRHLVKAVTNE